MTTPKKAAPGQGRRLSRFNPRAGSGNDSTASRQYHHLDLLDQFDGLKQTAPDRWIARCPAHDDRSPSLAIKDVGDRLLAHCFSGCTFRDIADGLGVLPSAFFAGGRYDRREYDRPYRVPWRDAFVVARHEFWVLLLVAKKMQKGPLPGGGDLRLMEAGRRIESAWRACSGE